MDAFRLELEVQYKASSKVKNTFRHPIHTFYMICIKLILMQTLFLGEKSEED
jgi:hypothetical protein